jgi:hypothetical protein
MNNSLDTLTSSIRMFRLALVQNCIKALDMCLQIGPEYDDVMAYENLLLTALG